ncbi:hypothetical protein CCZ01_04905 [Helicobacter monodelphidis]|uniref:hypothetical protein n=1 Tax=Helicobacter sp. 15-1451 TaxID=2004995 RepID=UPI000DCC9829|nr:hypothetical protein [Helicobacter sp. 15-1451]RAX57789.1 hypothetical protein CCZ01_04905 [Helicobacter sp. 15-1451]
MDENNNNNNDNNQPEENTNLPKEEGERVVNNGSEKALEFLRQEGVEKIHKQTYIALFKIEAVLDRDYEQFDKVTAQGFIRILEREYNIDLSGWMDDYDRYCQEHGLFKADEYDSPSLIDVNVKIDRYEKHTSSKWLNIAIATIVVVLGGSYYIFNVYGNTYDEIVNNEHFEGGKAVVEDIRRDLEAQVGIENNQTKAESNETVATEVNGTMVEQNMSIVAQSLNEEPPLVDQNITREIIFSLNGPLWLGILEVDTKKRVYQNVYDRFVVKGEKPLLFRTGHGRFNVSVGEIENNFTSGSPLYLYYAPNEGLRAITEAEFRSINGGGGW